MGYFSVGLGFVFKWYYYLRGFFRFCVVVFSFIVFILKIMIIKFGFIYVVFNESGLG